MAFPQSAVGSAIKTLSLTSLAEQQKSLLPQMLSMRHDDVLTLRAITEGPDMELKTPPGTANDLLWASMERFGWLKSRNEATPPGNGGAGFTRVYAVTPSGAKPIGEMLEIYAAERSRLDAQMVTIANEVCGTFAVELVRKVKAAGGGLCDVSTLLAMAFEGVLRGVARPADRKRYADGLLDDMKRHFAM